MSQRDPFLVDWTKKTGREIFTCARIQPGKESAMDPNGPLQKCAGVSKGKTSSLKAPGEKKRSLSCLKGNYNNNSAHI